MNALEEKLALERDNVAATSGLQGTNNCFKNVAATVVVDELDELDAVRTDGVEKNVRIVEVGLKTMEFDKGDLQYFAVIILLAEATNLFHELVDLGLDVHVENCLD